MKKIYSLIILLVGIAVFTACDDDRDSNPTLQSPTSFVLNIPPYANAVYDLQNTEKVEFTGSQPDYGFTAATTYAVQISVSGSFDSEDSFATLATTSTNARVIADAKEMAVAIVGLLGVEVEEDFPTDPFKLYVRLRASVGTEQGVVYSNVIELPNVVSYFALEAMVMPTDMYLIGSVNGWDWSNAFSMISVNSTPGKFWIMQYFEENAEIKFNSVKDYNGNEFGFAEEYFPESSVTYAGLEDAGGNLKITNAGWYIVVVAATIEGREYLYNVEFLPPNVYLTGNTSGGWDSFTETNLFTVPADADGEFVSPAFVASDEVRICVLLEDQQWWHTEFIILDGQIAYRATGGDQDRVQGSVGERVYLNFTEGTGQIK